ncbi:ATP-binding cassette domain-containing protein [Streptomyces oceani]|uniref:ABC-type xenobiotic transporter n=1 Tax=Streptomyces oceani TaxID=1075402 RepID=A0A1E7KEZ9_9ACTN|nr:ATP-binding cassette domain-containing protein [Streptomyces oceani]OEV02464.1 ABC transporter [Streptomyces oceani]
MMRQDTSGHGRNAVEVRGLVKHFGDTKAVDGVHLNVREGTVMGVLGPNGAGKTTLVRMLCTLQLPDSGTATVAGYDVARQPRPLRRRIGLTGQYASVDERLSGFENLYMIGRLLDFSRSGARQRAYEMLERFSLTDAASKPIMKYSGGMRRRLDLAASMMGNPEVLFLDEPTTGLDPRTRQEVWDHTQQIVAEGNTVLLTTQYMEEAEYLADELTVIDHGKVIAEGRIADLKARVGQRMLVIRPAVPQHLQHLVGVLTHYGLAGTVADEAQGVATVPIVSDEQLSGIVRVLGYYNYPIADIATHLPSLDEVFLALTGQKTDSQDAGPPGSGPQGAGSGYQEAVA